MDRLYNVVEAGKLLGVSRWSVYKYHKDGLLKFIKVNGRNKVSETEIRRMRGEE